MTENAMNSNIRIAALDYIKGIGILSFIYWHAISYTYVHGIWTSPPGRFLHYATGMFIFVAGLLVGFRYSAKVEKIEDTPHVYQRLATRGCKLLALYSIGYLFKEFLRARHFSIDILTEFLTETTSLFYVDRWDLPLQILFVIGVYLIMSPLTIYFLRRKMSSVWKALFFAVAIGELLYQRPLPYFWHYLFVGFAGGLFGFGFRSHFAKIHSIIRTKFLYVYLPIAATVTAINALSAASEQFYNLFLNWTSLNLISVSGNILAFGLPFFFWVDVQKRTFRPLAWLSLLGCYSLLVYILQISALIGAKTLGFLPNTASNLVPIGVALLLSILSIAAVSVTARLRRYGLFNRVYKLIFA